MSKDALIVSEDELRYMLEAFQSHNSTKLPDKVSLELYFRVRSKYFMLRRTNKEKAVKGQEVWKRSLSIEEPITQN